MKTKKLIFVVMMMVFFIMTFRNVISQITDPRQIEGVLVEARVYLAGYMSSDTLDIFMRSDHLDAGLLPSTPLDVEGGMGYKYPDQSKWLSGNRSFYVPDSILRKVGAVGYGQLELRDNMFSPSKQYFEYCIIGRNGNTYNLQGGRRIRFKTVTQGNFYLIVHAGNHLSVGSKNYLNVSQPIVYDFTTGLDKYFNEAAGRRYENEPAVEVRPGIWAMYGGDCSGSGLAGDKGPDNFNDFSDKSYIYNHFGSGKYHLADLEANCKVSESDFLMFDNWAFYSSYIPYITITAPAPMGSSKIGNTIMQDNPNNLPRYQLTANAFSKNGDTITFSVHIQGVNQDTIPFRWAQLMLRVKDSTSRKIDTISFDCPIQNSQIFLSENVIQIGMMSNSPIRISTAPYQLAKVKLVFKPGTCPQIQGLLRWTTEGLRTKIFAQIDSQIVDITNHQAHFIDDSILAIHSILLREPSDYLSQNYPNPFNPVTTIAFYLPSATMAEIKVFDITGKEVATLTNQIMPAGYHSITFDATKLTSGIYFYKLEAGNIVKVNKMILIK